MTSATGLVAQARATARAARGAPIELPPRHTCASRRAGFAAAHSRRDAGTSSRACRAESKAADGPRQESTKRLRFVRQRTIVAGRCRARELAGQSRLERLGLVAKSKPGTRRAPCARRARTRSPSSRFRIESPGRRRPSGKRQASCQACPSIRRTDGSVTHNRPRIPLRRAGSPNAVPGSVCRPAARRRIHAGSRRRDV